jgi:hypothetical protein
MESATIAREELFAACCPEQKSLDQTTKPPGSPVGELTCRTPGMLCPMAKPAARSRKEEEERVRWPSTLQQPRVGTEVRGSHIDMETARRTRVTGSLYYITLYYIILYYIILYYIILYYIIFYFILFLLLYYLYIYFPKKLCQ